MCFYFVADEKCMSRTQADGLKREFMAVLQREAVQQDRNASELPLMAGAVAQ
jgi:hypothetical protein